MTRSSARAFARTLPFLTYTVLALGSRTFSLSDSQLSVFWPAAGVAAVWLTTIGSGRRLAAATAFIAALNTLTLLQVGYELGPALVLGVLGHTLLAGLFRLVYRRLPGSPPLGPLLTGVDLLRLVAAAVVSSTLTALPVVLATTWQTGGWQPQDALTWVVRSTTGAILVGAFLLTAGYRLVRPRGAAGLPPRDRTSAQRWELVSLGALTVAAMLVVFGPQHGVSLSFLLVALATWTGSRFRPGVAATHSLVMGFSVTVCTVQGWGPFAANPTPLAQALTAQAFVGVTTVLSLALALGAQERSRLNDLLRRSEVDARRQAAMLSAVTHAMDDGLAVADEHMHVSLRNRAAQAYLATDAPEDSVGTTRQHGFRLPDGRELPPEEFPHIRALRHGSVAQQALLHIHPETGEETMTLVTATPLDDYEGSTNRAAVILIHDVTAEHRRFQELERFAGVVAHDLKTPLTAVTGWSELLQEQLDALDAPNAPGVSDIVGRIQSSAERMWCLIDDLLDFTRSTSGELHVTDVDLQELTTDIAAGIRSTPAGAEATFHVEGLGRVTADVLLVEQVLVNLLGNAVKYVAPGVTPRVEVLGAADGAWLEVTIRDNGIGIPDEDRRKVFEPFVRSATEGYTGTGLGLAIARRAIERHGGTIRVGAGPGDQGTEFSFALPVAAEADRLSGTAGPSASSTAGRPTRALHVA